MLGCHNFPQRRARGMLELRGGKCTTRKKWKKNEMYMVDTTVISSDSGTYDKPKF